MRHVTVCILVAGLAGVCAGAGGRGGGVAAHHLNLALLADGDEGEAGATRAARGAASQRWLDIVEEYARSAMAERRGRGRGHGSGRGEWPPRPFRLELPRPPSAPGSGSRRSRTETLPVLVVPVPVSVTDDGCSVDRERGYRRRFNKQNYYDDDDDNLDEVEVEVEDEEEEEEEEVRPPTRRRPTGRDRPRVRPVADPRPRPGTARRTANRYKGEEEYDDEDSVLRTPPPRRPAARRPAPRARPPALDVRTPPPPPAPAPDAPRMDVYVSSQYLVQQFRAQSPAAPGLPPAVLPAAPPPRPAWLPPAGGPHPPAQLSPGAAPPPPRWPATLLLRGELTVPRADYTEPYVVWWDGASGTTRVELHGGATTTYQQQADDGHQQLVEVRVDRSAGVPVTRCGVATSRRRVERAPPALPDLSLFQFAGYSEEEGGGAEVWRRAVRGAAGEAGAARGEALAFHHEVLLRRGAAGDAVPLRYSVEVDSSVLGPGCDRYEHRYLEAAAVMPEPTRLYVDLESQCEAMETLDADNAEHMARLQPLREFTLPTRDPRYDAALIQFKKEYQRNYTDDKEEAVRKNQLMQHTRFVTSCNRQGAPFEVAVNFLGDRLRAELDVLLGAEPAAERVPAELSPAEDRAAATTLPDRFDWRERGAVSHVRYQGSCSSCWAVAVTGAVEGALWRTTRTLTPLAEQALVDCAHTFGAHGCNGTWPSFAYDYVRERGLPALAEYGPHRERVERCRDGEVSPVTRITAHVNVTRDSEPALKVAIKKHAPTVVIIDAKAMSFIFYKKGVLYDERCGKRLPRLNHAVLAVGWESRAGGPDVAAGTHFVVKNSWSAAWGEAGYARLHAPSSTCGVTALPSYPRLEPNDVLQRAAGASSDEDED